MSENDHNITQKILEGDEFEVDDKQKHDKKTADSIDSGGANVKKYKETKNKVDSKVEEYERTISGNLPKLKEQLEEYVKLKESEDFKEDYRDELIEVEDFDKADEIIELFREIVPAFTLIKELLAALSSEQDDMIDVQQLTHDEARVKEMVDKMMDLHKDMIERLGDSYEESLEKYGNSVKQMSDDLERLEDAEANREEKLVDTLDKLAEAIEDGAHTRGSPQNAPNQRINHGAGEQYQSRGQDPRSAPTSQTQDTRTQARPDQSQQGAASKPDLDQFDLSPEERELAEQYWRRHNEPGFEQKDLLPHCSYKSKGTISKKLQEFEERGIISKREG